MRVAALHCFVCRLLDAEGLCLPVAEAFLESSKAAPVPVRLPKLKDLRVSETSWAFLGSVAWSERYLPTRNESPLKSNSANIGPLMSDFTMLIGW